MKLQAHKKEGMSTLDKLRTRPNTRRLKRYVMNSFHHNERVVVRCNLIKVHKTN
jgi:hypothetical protein